MAFNRLYTALWSRREISRKTKSQFHAAVVRIILLYGCDTWPFRRKRPDVFDNDCLRRIEPCNRRERVLCAIVHQRLQLQTLPALQHQRHHRRPGHADHRPPGVFMRELIDPNINRTWRKQTGEQLKIWAATLKVNLVRLVGPAEVGIRS